MTRIDAINQGLPGMIDKIIWIVEVWLIEKQAYSFINQAMQK